jgi:membrane associated rhomboid family serine protease
MKIRYNSPVILTFSLIATCIQLMDASIIQGLTKTLFAVGPTVNLANPLDYFRLTTHVLGHAGWQHLFGNLTFILLLGPLLEEKYGSPMIFLMICMTAIVTGIVNILFFSTGLLGASGIVFMLIVLASIVDFRSGAIPLTFVLVAGVFIGSEIIKAFGQDNISQIAHVLGGFIGAVFGFLLAKPLQKKKAG